MEKVCSQHTSLPLHKPSKGNLNIVATKSILLHPHSWKFFRLKCIFRAFELGPELRLLNHSGHETLNYSWVQTTIIALTQNQKQIQNSSSMICCVWDSTALADKERNKFSQRVHDSDAALMTARIYCTFVASTTTTLFTFTTRLSWSPAKTRFYNDTESFLLSTTHTTRDNGATNVNSQQIHDFINWLSALRGTFVITLSADWWW